MPLPVRDKEGWPWTAIAANVVAQSNNECPRFSVLMPSFNQAGFIEQAIRSVLCQDYPSTEIIIIDGGSTDGTLDIIKRYEPWLAYWVSEPDGGMAEALNKAFRLATGEFIGWLNTDDYYGAGSVEACARAAARAPECDIYHGRTKLVDINGTVINELSSGEFDLNKAAEYFPLIGLPNQSCFIRKTALGEAFVDESYKCGMDTELLARLVLRGCRTMYVDGIVGHYRIHPEAKTFREGSTSYVEACRLCLETLRRRDLPQELRSQILKGYRRMLVGLFRTGDSANFRSFAKEYLLLRRVPLDLDILGRVAVSFMSTRLLRAMLRLSH